ncbi:MAG: hypothetical protein AB8F74_08845, partial [Saprospiraceae bacterium]
MLQSNPLLYTITQLREQEQLFLNETWYPHKSKEVAELENYLKLEYQRECKDYPFKAPPFNSKAAVWAAVFVGQVASLILFRFNSKSVLKKVKAFEGPIDPSAILSADLTLRFLPTIWLMLKNIDSDDPAVALIFSILKEWSYSAVHHLVEPDEIPLDGLWENPCLKQLFIDRIIAQ